MIKKYKLIKKKFDVYFSNTVRHIRRIFFLVVEDTASRIFVADVLFFLFRGDGDSLYNVAGFRFLGEPTGSNGHIPQHSLGESSKLSRLFGLTAKPPEAHSVRWLLGLSAQALSSTWGWATCAHSTCRG